MLLTRFQRSCQGVLVSSRACGTRCTQQQAEQGSRRPTARKPPSSGRSLRGIMSATILCWLGSSLHGAAAGAIIRSRSMAFAGPWRAASTTSRYGASAFRPLDVAARCIGGRRLYAAVSGTSESLREAIQLKGQQIRDMKTSGADKGALQPLIDDLLTLKKQYEVAAGQPYDPPSSGKKGKGGGQKAAAAQPKPVVNQDEDGVMVSTKNTESLVITSQDINYSQWYLDVIAAADLVDQSPVKGCMVIKPYGMALWDALREDLDKRIKQSGAQNAYFPLFIPRSFLSKEAEHVEGFAKECAVVTHHRLCADPNGNGLIPDPSAKLEEPLIVRPTSETIIWNMFSRWISSHRDLPLKINQWANVVRWEMRTRPFLRSTEFLWQEGHTAHASRDEALAYARSQLDMYVSLCEELLAVPVIKGVKSLTERFAGADETFTIEALMPNGWALQSGTSHFLGQNFAKAFDVFYQTAEGGRELVWATSWGVSTRLLGALVMTHSDDAGLVLPPKIAPIQVVVVPILKGDKEAPENDPIIAFMNLVVDDLRGSDIRVHIDDRPKMRPGAKYFEWERKGVPLRLEIGQRDAAAASVTLARRTGGPKSTIQVGNDFGRLISAELTAMQSTLLKEAGARLSSKTIRVESYEDMKARISSGDRAQAGFYLVPWKDDAANEAAIKEDCKATIRCFPLDVNSPEMVRGRKCFYSGEPATHIALFARAF